MKLLFSNAGAERLDQSVSGRMLCAFDFDGTLAPIVAVPDEARLPDNIRMLLEQIAQHAPIAIITGRSVDDISRRLGFQPDYVVGNHGLEGVPGWEDLAAEHEHACAGWRRQLDQAARGTDWDPGIQLEDKRFSLSVHYRQAEDVARCTRALESVFAKLEPQPRVVGGKYVYNLLMQDRCHKGSALSRLMELSGAKSALYVGDDVTDEDVFRMRRPDILSIRIEPSADSAADYFLPHPRDILRLLEELIARLQAARASNWLREKGDRNDGGNDNGRS
ncbi:trehalose-phosphatase [Noviherbaspirillum sp. CPCC 100848]|uniref:Trehalose 6-phosphate phosphatase n=1 Tax=Noviherbaspirillum album TaxID=3080276 RepID=A0ABU6J7A6_9BURK|nr:trehalose-phosphatase [Noviherbaspirillum sp. CPCC 100848]MEC4719328.1 trehalose-phosphatase [Noviherbaspirillum sp. CPCC 100848]